MIISGLLDLIFGLIKIVFGWINLPEMPSAITSIVDELFTIFEGAVGLLGVFVDLQFLAVCMPILVVIINFEHLYRGTMFIIRKLPLNIN